MLTARPLWAHGDEIGPSPMWCETGRPDSSIASQTSAIRGLLKSTGCPSGCTPGFSGSQNVLMPSAFASDTRPPRAFAVPPVDEPDAVEAAVGALLQLGEVLVVDPEAQLAHLVVGQPHQRQQRVGERQLPGDAVGVELRQPGVEIGGAAPGIESYCISTLVNAGGSMFLPAGPRVQEPSWKKTRGACSFSAAGNRS